MPSYLIKPRPDEDWYCEWSSIVDAPTAWGPRSSFVGVNAERFARADAKGSSVVGSDSYGWADPYRTVMVRECGLPYNAGILPLADLRPFCEALARDDLLIAATLAPKIAEGC